MRTKFKLSLEIIFWNRNKNLNHIFKVFFYFIRKTLISYLKYLCLSQRENIKKFSNNWINFKKKINAIVAFQFKKSNLGQVYYTSNFMENVLTA